MRHPWYLLILASLGVWVSLGPQGAIAQESAHDRHLSMPQSSAQFRRIEQPLWLKGGITAGGVGLIGLELWWFLGHHPKTNPKVAKRP